MAYSNQTSESRAPFAARYQATARWGFVSVWLGAVIAAAGTGCWQQNTNQQHGSLSIALPPTRPLDRAAAPATDSRSARVEPVHGRAESDKLEPPSAMSDADIAGLQETRQQTATEEPSQTENRNRMVSTSHTEPTAKNMTETKRKQKRQTLYEKLLFYPSKYPEGDWNPTELTHDDVWFTASDGVRLHGWYCPCKDARAVILYAHGNGGHLAHRLPVLQVLQKTLHCTVFIFDYRGYGRSEGKPTIQGILADARAARATLAQRAGVDESALVLMGRSLGGAVAVQLAAESAPRALVLESTFSTLRDVAKVHFRWLAWIVPAETLNSVNAIARYHGPLLQSHGDNDRTVPYGLGKKLFDAAKAPKQFVTIRGGDHNAPQTPEYYTQLDHFIGNLAARPVESGGKNNHAGR